MLLPLLRSARRLTAPFNPPVPDIVTAGNHIQHCGAHTHTGKASACFPKKMENSAYTTHKEVDHVTRLSMIPKKGK